ncbi:hypothetical protein DL764_010161 [Monosporascus ibericus]|uniref:F-box domain-containing protein n=1 Tax=Monosporascus ibericus TaxID=155417 RepID=A0A4Q4SVY6_9PEZI|nr:hypothetical protein DL764_010161 [Monosporascus ibericus]
MILLTELPPEILHNVLVHVDPPDLAWMPRICRTFYHAVSQNAPLFKEVYLRNFDTPPNSRELDWERAIRDLVRLQVVCRRTSVHDKKNELSFVYDTVTRLLMNASSEGDPASPVTVHQVSRNAELLSSIFKEETNQAAFLCRSFIYQRARAELKYRIFSSPPLDDHQKSAHLHCLYSVPMLYAHPESHRTRSSKMSPFACSKVYDLRQYTEDSMWGPFMDDGSGDVDWEKMEAIMIVLGANLKQFGLNKFPICKTVWDRPFPGVWRGGYRPLSTSDREPEPLELQDPYGVSGTWLRVVCFLDYTDFFTYNFNPEHQPPPTVPRPAIDVGEATRFILMKLHVTAIEPPGPEDGQALPVVHFEGVCRSIDASWEENANSDIRGMIQTRGTVRLTREGEVRWTSFSVYAGEDRWRSEGIQVGGPRSGKGVLGTWFDNCAEKEKLMGSYRDFDPRGPAGPNAFWKISDKGHRDDPDRVVMADFMRTIIEAGREEDDDDEDYEPPENGDDDGDEDDGENGLEELESLMETEIEYNGTVFWNWTEVFDP